MKGIRLFCSIQNIFLACTTNAALMVCLFMSQAAAQTMEGSETTNKEEKVDYLERIYFSGENKEGLNMMIMITLQELNEKLPTPALAKQFNFLLDVKDNAEAAANACDVLDLLAAGIYNIDAAEAKQQGVRTPSEKAKLKSADALASLDKLSRTSNSLSQSAGNAAWSSYLLSGGKYSAFTSGAGKLARGAGTAGVALGAVGQAGNTARQLGNIGKEMGISLKKKDKPCDDVPKKEIKPGQHLLPGASSPAVNAVLSKITIKNITYNQLGAVVAGVEKITGVNTVNGDDFNNSIATLTVSHGVKIKELIDKITNLDKSISYNIESVSGNNAVLSIK